MKDHNKISFVREYCRCRRIPYKIDRETLYINKHYFCFSVYSLTYLELVQAIDKACTYDSITTYFVSYNGHKNYHSYPSIVLGGSDVARLCYTVHNNGAETEGFINFGEDGRYSAYVVDKYAIIPYAYKCVLHVFIDNPSDSLTIYDNDTQESTSFICKTNNLHQFVQKSCIHEISGLYQIIVYRCGMRGCIIQLMTFDDFKSDKEII